MHGNVGLNVHSTRMCEHVHVDDVLAEYLAEVYALYSFVEEGECKWYTHIYVLYFFREGRGVQMVYMCLCGICMKWLNRL